MTSKHHEYTKNEIFKSIETITKLSKDDNQIDKIVEVGKLCAKAVQAGNKVLFAGNGGSAADSQHLAAEFVSKLSYNRPAMASIALTTDTSALTAIGNDYGFQYLFSRQIEAIGNKGDIFIGISTSGNSENIIHALEASKNKGLISVGLTGMNEGKMDVLCDHIIRSPSKVTPKIQEAHIIMGHIICAIAEDIVFGKEYAPKTNL